MGRIASIMTNTRRIAKHNYHLETHSNGYHGNVEVSLTRKALTYHEVRFESKDDRRYLSQSTIPDISIQK